MDEADQFYADMNVWLRANFVEESPKPTHLVMYETLFNYHRPFWEAHEYRNCQKFFHTKFFEAPRQSEYIVVLCRK